METLQDFAALFTRWRVWYLLARQDIALRYRRSALGPFWITASIAVFTLGVSYVYAKIFGTSFEEHFRHVATGYTMWHFISAMILDGSHSVIEGTASLKSVRMPLSVLAARTVGRNIIIFMHNLAGVLPLFYFFAGGRVTPALIWIIPGLCCYTVLAVLVAMALGPLGARYRDFSEMLRSVISLAFFVTPVIWPVGRLGTSSWIIQYNPLYHLIELVRAPLLGAAPTDQDWTMTFACLLLAAGGALVSLQASRGRLMLWV